MHHKIFSSSVMLFSALSLVGCTGSNSYTQGHNTQSYGAQEYAAQGCSPAPQYEGYDYAYVAPAQNCVGAGGVYQAAPAQYNSSSFSAYGGNDLRGVYPVSYGEGTVLHGDAPYGAAVYHNRRAGSGRVQDGKGAYLSAGAILYDVNDSVVGIQGRIGYNFNRYFAAELEASTGGGDGLNVEYSTAAFAVAKLPIGSRLSLLVRGGYQATRLNDGISSVNVDGIAYGSGVELALDRNNAIRVDYTRYDYSGVTSADALAVSYVRQF